MSSNTPKGDARAAKAAKIPSPPPANYDDELTPAQLAALRLLAPQNESEMGDLVHEFRW